MAAGTVTTTEERLSNTHKVTFAWTSGTDADAGTATATTTYPYNGALLRVVTVPGLAPNVPTDDYDITLTDEDGVDLTAGQLINRDDTNMEMVSTGMGYIVGDKLTFTLANAGAAKTGACYVYIGSAADVTDPVADVENALYGTTGIAAFPAAAAAANNVSLAEVVRYIQEVQAAKIDALATNGLTGTADSLAYRVGEVERHFHNWERWMLLAAVPSGTHKADRIGATATSTAPFVLTSGNDTWGTWVQLLGSGDTPVVAGGVKFDVHRLLVTTTNQTGVWFIQVGVGASGAAAVTAETLSSIVYVSEGVGDRSDPIEVLMRRQAAGALVWARAWSVGSNAKTISIMFGLHEYEG